jgi:hypothetical protein
LPFAIVRPVGSFRSRIRKSLAPPVILVFLSRMTGSSTYGDGLDGLDEVCVCMTAQRSFKHPRQGALPACIPTKEGASPLCWILPHEARGGGVA